jgi:hypothetical protein
MDLQHILERWFITTTIVIALILVVLFGLIQGGIL